MTTFVRKDVESSSIGAIGYRHDLEQMAVEFKNGKRYIYERVPHYEYRAFSNAESFGRYFARMFRNNPASFPFHEVDREDELWASAQDAQVDHAMPPGMSEKARAWAW